MKKLLSRIMLLSLALVMAVGCSKNSENGDASSLLRTIPADASSVAIVNLRHTVESLGCKTDGSTIELTPEMQKAIFESNAVSDSNKQLFNDLCSGQTGISVSSIAFFSAARSYVTGLLNDADKFVEYAERRTMAEADSTAKASAVQEMDGARVIGKSVVVIGNQFWVCTQGFPDVEQLKYCQKLNEQQSYASSETAPLLLEDGKVVTYVADVNRSFDRMSESSYLRMGASLMFDDIAYVAGSARFEKENVVATSKVLNSKMKPAELQLPTEKIDTKVVKSLNKNGEVFIAAGIPGKLSGKVADALSAIVGAGAGAFANPIKQIEGTAAVCMDVNGESLLARISTTGKDFASLSNLIQMMPGVSVTRNGDMLTVKYGDTGVATGSITAEEAASCMKGAWIGLVTSDIPAKGMTTSARLVPEEKSLRLDIEVEGGLNAFMTALLR